MGASIFNNLSSKARERSYKQNLSINLNYPHRKKIKTANQNTDHVTRFKQSECKLSEQNDKVLKFGINNNNGWMLPFKSEVIINWRVLIQST